MRRTGQARDPGPPIAWIARLNRACWSTSQSIISGHWSTSAASSNGEVTYTRAACLPVISSHTAFSPNACSNWSFFPCKASKRARLADGSAALKWIWTIRPSRVKAAPKGATR